MEKNDMKRMVVYKGENHYVVCDGIYHYCITGDNFYVQGGCKECDYCPNNENKMEIK